MKLIKCHIENYGKLKNLDLAFNSALTSLCFENGYGKSTITSFIRSMLFGMKGVRAGGKEFSDRQKYFPFSGGVFGGSLTVLHDGKEYKIERFFDVKSDTKDSLAVFCNGEMTDALTENIGEFLLGIDRDSFERAMLMNSTDVQYGGSSAISARLWGLDADGGKGFESAMDALDARRKEIKAARGRSGELQKTEDSISLLMEKIENTDRISLTLDELYKNRASLDKSIKSLEETRDKAEAEGVAEEKKKSYARLICEAEKAKRAGDELSARYPEGVLSANDEATVKGLLSELEHTLGASGAVSPNERNKERFDALKAKFSTVERAQELAQSARELSLEYKKELSSEKSSKGIRYGERFANGVPGDEAIAEQEKNAAAFAEFNEAAICAIKKKAKIPPRTALLISGALFVAAGITMIFVSLIAAALLGAVGILMIGCSFTIKSANDVGKLMKKADEAEAPIRAFLSPFGYNTEGRGSAAYAFSVFKAERAAYLEDTARSSGESQGASAEFLKEACLLARSAGYSEIKTGEELYGLSELMAREADEFIFLTSHIQDSESRQSALLEKAGNIRARLITFANKLGISGDDAHLTENIRTVLDKAVADRGAILQNEITAQRLLYTAEKYRLDAGLESLKYEDALKISSEENEDKNLGFFDKNSRTKALETKLDSKRTERAKIEQQISSAESHVEHAPDYKRELAAAKEKLDELRHELKLIDEASRALTTAEQNLSIKYVAPLKEKFISYAEMIEGSIGEKYTIDKALNIRFEAAGASRDERHMSQGEHAIIALALKLSLIDSMYGSEGFVILDDPFSSLDEKNLAKMKNLIRLASKNRQLVYFTCHFSRSIEV